MSTPFQLIARLPGPISSKDVEAAVAGAPEGSTTTTEEIIRDLGQIVDTNYFGDKTPKLADDLTAALGKLAPITEPGAMNNTAAAFAAVLTTPPAPGQIYADAHILQAAVTGAVVAMEAEIAADNPQQAGDKRILIDAYKTHLASYDTLTVYNGLWATLAKDSPGVKAGTFVVPHEAAVGIAEVLTTGEMDEGFKAFLHSKLPTETASAEPKDPAAVNAEAKAAAIQRELTRPIAGKDDKALEAIYTKATAEAKTQRIVHRPERFRTEKYQKLLNVLNESPMTEILKPMLRELIARYNIDSRRQQKASYTEITPANHKSIDDKQLQAIRTTAKRVAERMGAGDPSVTRVAQGVLNAWVSSVDLDNPHITYFSHLQDIVWDGEKGDWLKFHVDANGNFCKANVKGAREISGETLVEVVFAHELTHISEGAVLNQYLMSILLGVNLKDKPQLFGDGCVCSGCQAIAEKTELATKIMDDPRIAAFIASGEFREMQAQVAKKLPIESALTNLHSSDAGVRASALSGLESFFLMFTREGESTADFGAVRLMGPEGPRFMAMAFDIVNRSTGKGSPAERLQALKDSWSRNHKALNEQKLEESEENGAVSHAMYATQTTHPTAMLRAIGNFDHAKSAETRAIWSFESRPVRIRLLGAAHAVDSEIERIEDEHADFQHGSADHMAPEQIMKTLEDQHTKRAIRQLYERMRGITSEIAKLVFEDGLHLDSDIVPYAVHVASFIKQGGEAIFRHEESAGNPLAALLGGGSGESPQCVKMAGQLADELERIVDNAELPEKEAEGWAGVVGLFRSYADEDGAKTARINRTKQNVAARAMRRAG